MEDIPPSYHQSTNPSVLELIAPWLNTRSLHALTLVSRAYNATFMPHLWGSPASHFVPVTGPTSPGVLHQSMGESSYDDMVYVALTRFKRILRIARYSTRCLVHTLYLPPAASEIYSGPNATWLREILDGLPNLQSLCVSCLPFFDHHSLVAVDKHRPSLPDQGHNTYPVKLLLAAKEANTTSIGLSLFLPHLNSLVYLDLSYTSPARDVNVLYSFAALSHLQVLKLRGVGLRDMEAEVLANAIELRVRLLDVSDNLLGDVAIRSLLQACFVHTDNSLPVQNSAENGVAATFIQSDAHSRRHLESWPVGLPPAPDFLSLDILRSADFDQNLLKQLTNPLTGRLAFEDIPHGGLTHLYITGNPAVTVEGVKSLLEVGRLHVLDAGDISRETPVDKYVKSLRGAKWRERTTSITSSGNKSNPESPFSGNRADNEYDDLIFSEDEMHLPSAEKLVPTLKDRASRNLTHLRIEHTLITKEADITQKKVSSESTRHIAELSSPPPDTVRVEVPGSHHQATELSGSNYHAVELSSDATVFELDSTPAFRAELPGDPVHFALTPPTSGRPAPVDSAEEVRNPVRGEGPFAPEVVENSRTHTQFEPEVVLNATGSGAQRVPVSPLQSAVQISPHDRERTQTIESVLEGQLPPSISPSRPTQSVHGNDHWTQIQQLLKQRPVSTSPKLHPGSVPNLRTLALTNIPAHVHGPSASIIKSIKDFIAGCALEAYIAVLRARTNYSLPPGRARAAAERKHAQSLFALRTIVLEVSPVQNINPRDWKHMRHRLNISKSSTGDRDSEALWSAAENDFSFFGEEGEEHDECGIYEHEPGKYFPLVHLDDKFAINPDDNVSSPMLGANNSYSATGSNSLNINSPTATIFRSPRELPLGRNRRPSNESRPTTTPDSATSPFPFPDRVNQNMNELPGSIPTSNPRATTQLPTSAPKIQQPQPQLQPQPVIDVVAELSKWRRERKTAYEQDLRRRSRVDGVTQLSRLAETEVYCEGHWKGEIKVVRKPKPLGVVNSRTAAAGDSGRLERTGMVDVYGNYFEKGYLYS